MENLSQYIEIDAEKLGGVPVFAGTRVPLENLFDCLEGGETVDEFLDQFPTVEREQVLGVLEVLKTKAFAEIEYEVAA
jgi:uncharacterized protein (DUF433 family)